MPHTYDLTYTGFLYRDILREINNNVYVFANPVMGKYTKVRVMDEVEVYCNGWMEITDEPTLQAVWQAVRAKETQEEINFKKVG